MIPCSFMCTIMLLSLYHKATQSDQVEPEIGEVSSLFPFPYSAPYSDFSDFSLLLTAGSAGLMIERI